MISINNLKIGTCSWKYDSWVGLVYSHPDKQNYLQEYAVKFNTVEVDQWFWSLFQGKSPVLPNVKTVQEYADAVPDDFKFSIKVPNSLTLTHFYNRDKKKPLEKNPYFLSNELFDSFLETIAPLQDKTGPIIFQFEYLNKIKMPDQQQFLQRFSEFIERCPKNFSYAIETRNPQYLNSKYFSFLNEQNLRHVFLQGYYMPPITDVYKTHHKLVKNPILRIHGPNRNEMEIESGNNWSKIISPKDDELFTITQMIRYLIENNNDIYVNINNHYEGSAPITIKKIKTLLATDSDNISD